MDIKNRKKLKKQLTKTKQNAEKDAQSVAGQIHNSSSFPSHHQKKKEGKKIITPHSNI